MRKMTKLIPKIQIHKSYCRGQITKTAIKLSRLRILKSSAGQLFIERTRNVNLILFLMITIGAHC